MKFLFFTFFLIFTNQLFAQSSLDKKLTEFAQKHNLYGKKLLKLEAIGVDSKLSEGGMSDKWHKAFVKWDKNDVTKQFDAEQELINYLPDTYYNYRRAIPGYTIDFLLFRMYELVRFSELSDENSVLLKQLLKQQVREKPEFSKDVSEINRAVQELFSNSIVGLSNLDQLVDFLAINDPDLVGKDLETKIKAIGNYDDTDWLAYSQYLTKLNMYQSKYGQITGLTGAPSYGGVDLSTVLGSAFFDFVNNRHALTISEWNQGDYIKYEMFLEEKAITDFLLLNLLTKSYFEAQRSRVNLSKIGQESYKKIQVPGYDALTGSEYVLSRKKMRIAPVESNMSNIQKLLVAAYNDVYINLESSSSRRKEDRIRDIDLSELGLSFDQQNAIDAILSEDARVTKQGLKLALSNGLFENIEWDLEFKLACYFALYNKSNNLMRDWNNAEYVINPFGPEEDEITKDFAVLNSLELIQLKEECLKILEATGYSKMRFRINFDGDKMTTVSPNIPEAKIIGNSVKKAAAKYPDLGNLSFFVETGEVPIREESLRVMPYRDVSPPPPPPVPVGRPRGNAGQAEIVEFPEVDAEFPGGTLAMKDWIEENLVYPEISIELGDQGRVYITFVVEINGAITAVDVMRGGITPELNREAKRIIRNMPKWTPAEVRGKPVRSRCRVPVAFTLD